MCRRMQWFSGTVPLLQLERLPQCVVRVLGLPLGQLLGLPWASFSLRLGPSSLTSALLLVVWLAA